MNSVIGLIKCSILKLQGKLADMYTSLQSSRYLSLSLLDNHMLNL